MDASQAEFEEGMRELEEKRLELADEGDDVVDDNFRWVLRGGTWTAHRTGLSYDCFMASARPGAGETFCEEWSLVRSASYIIRLYGEQLAFELAKGWVHWHQWFLSTSLAHEGDRGWAFTAEVLAEYREPAALTMLYGETSAPGRQRIDALRRLRPVRAP